MTNSKPFNVLAELHACTGLLSVPEVARILRKSRPTIYRMVNSREIPFLRIGGDLRFDPSSLMLWLSKKDSTLTQAAKQFRPDFPGGSK